MQTSEVCEENRHVKTDHTKHYFTGQPVYFISRASTQVRAEPELQAGRAADMMCHFDHFVWTGGK
jgi:hypothetical protein